VVQGLFEARDVSVGQNLRQEDLHRATRCAEAAERLVS
jgi:hypothetical protein